MALTHINHSSGSIKEGATGSSVRAGNKSVNHKVESKSRKQIAKNMQDRIIKRAYLNASKEPTSQKLSSTLTQKLKNSHGRKTV